MYRSFAIALALLANAAGAASVDRIVNVNLVRPQGIEYAFSVGIADGMIRSVDRAAMVAGTAGERVIDGGGRFLMPGLIDTHVHLYHPSLLGVFPGYGVTTVVNMRGRASHLRQRERLRRCPAFAADFVTAADYVDGNPPNMLPMAFVDSVEDAVSLVRWQHEQGYDFVKVYSELSRDQFLAICRTASEIGIEVAGHIPDAVNLADLQACPLVNVAHGEQLLKLLPEGGDAAELARQLSGASISVTANGALMLAMSTQPSDLDSLLARPEAAVLHPSVLQAWRPGFNRYQRRDAAWVQRITANNARVAEIVGQPILWPLVVAGTDTPVAGAYPGSSLIEEIEWLAASGLGAGAALAAATRNAGALVARLQPERPPVGRIEPGFQADLVLLRDNPLEDLGALRDVIGVMLDGRWYERDAIVAELDAIGRDNAATAPRVAAFERAMFGGDLEAMTEAMSSPTGPPQLLAQYPAFFIGRGWTAADEPELKSRALALFEHYAAMYPDVHSAHFMLGVALQSNGEPESARAAWRRSLELHPWYPPARERMQQ